MKSHAVFITAHRQVEVREENLPALQAGQVLVRTAYSAISPGTEMLLYRGEFPRGLHLDENLSALAGAFTYPLKYGYAAVGEVTELGAGVDPTWQGRRVFAFQPHADRFISASDELMPIPHQLSIEDAVFLPNMETAVNFVLDGAPAIGEQVAVLGQGIVGLLTTALLAQFPLTRLVTADRYALRRRASIDLGAAVSLDSGEGDFPDAARRSLGRGQHYDGADLVFELSGSPAALDQAIALCGFNGRVVIGSWYGSKQVTLDLGGRFHRSRIRLISSQVSTVTPELSGRWDKVRRFDLAWEMVEKVSPSRLITQRFPVSQAGEAYRLIDQNPGEAIQVIFEYP
jgi:2-desacetyl-2-hydroxyethyl bacteriochlorophyllide A dehydrogenase